MAEGHDFFTGVVESAEDPFEGGVFYDDQTLPGQHTRQPAPAAAHQISQSHHHHISHGPLHAPHSHLGSQLQHPQQHTLHHSHHQSALSRPQQSPAPSLAFPSPLTASLAYPPGPGASPLLSPSLAAAHPVYTLMQPGSVVGSGGRLSSPGEEFDDEGDGGTSDDDNSTSLDAAGAATQHSTGRAPRTRGVPPEGAGSIDEFKRQRRREQNKLSQQRRRARLRALKAVSGEDSYSLQNAQAHQSQFRLAKSGFASAYPVSGGAAAPSSQTQHGVFGGPGLLAGDDYHHQQHHHAATVGGQQQQQQQKYHHTQSHVPHVSKDTRGILEASLAGESCSIGSPENMTPEMEQSVVRYVGLVRQVLQYLSDGRLSEVEHMVRDAKEICGSMFLAGGPCVMPLVFPNFELEFAMVVAPATIPVNRKLMMDDIERWMGLAERLEFSQRQFDEIMMRKQEYQNKIRENISSWATSPQLITALLQSGVLRDPSRLLELEPRQINLLINLVLGETVWKKKFQRDFFNILTPMQAAKLMVESLPMLESKYSRILEAAAVRPVVYPGLQPEKKLRVGSAGPGELGAPPRSTSPSYFAAAYPTNSSSSGTLPRSDADIFITYPSPTQYGSNSSNGEYGTLSRYGAASASTDSILGATGTASSMQSSPEMERKRTRE